MTSTTKGLAPRLDVFDPALLDDPYPTYARLREASVVCRAGPATVAVTRHAEVSGLLRDPRLGHGVPDRLRRPAMFGVEEELVGRVLDAAQPNDQLTALVSALDPPRHTSVRRLLKKAMESSVLRRLPQQIDAWTDQLLAPALDAGAMDVVSELSLPLQTRVGCALLDVPESDREEVATKATELGRAIILIPFVTADRGNGESEARWLRAYVAGLLRQRRRHPGDDVISRMVLARDGDRTLTDDEIIDNAVFLFFAGFETSMQLVGGGIAALLEFPDQWSRLRADRSLVPSAVEELLRYDAPLQWISRITVSDVDVAGHAVRAGRFLLLLLASANRDHRAFHRPDRLDVGRKPNPQLSLGGGAHHCLGVQLARAEGAVVYRRLLARCAELAPAAAPVRRRHPNVRGYARLPVAVRAA